MPAYERTLRSVDMLKELYTVVVALALVQAITSLPEKTAGGGLVIHAEKFRWFLPVFFTLLPFYHGALRYLDETYVYAEAKPRRLALLLDYLILFIEACLLVGLGLLIVKPEGFVKLYAILLGVDILWIVLGYFLSSTGFKVSWRWLVINGTTLIVIAVVNYTPVLDAAKPEYIVYLAILRTVFDYAWCWKTYIPDS